MRSSKTFLGKIRQFWTFAQWTSLILCTSMKKGSFSENNEYAINGHLITHTHKGLSKGWPNFWALLVQTLDCLDLYHALITQLAVAICKPYSSPHWVLLGNNFSCNSLQHSVPSEINARLTIVTSSSQIKQCLSITRILIADNRVVAVLAGFSFSYSVLLLAYRCQVVWLLLLSPVAAGLASGYDDFACSPYLLLFYQGQ